MQNEINHINQVVEKYQLGDEQLYAIAHALPKIELHRHLEGSVRLETLVDIARQHAFEMPEYHVETLRPFVQMMPEEVKDAQHFIAKFYTLRQFYRSPEVIYRITSEAVIDAANDNIKYMELRFTPKALSNIIKATPRSVIEWVCDAATQTAKEYDIEVGLIVSMNRHESVQFGKQVLEATLMNIGKGVVGIDLAGIELGYPATMFRDIFTEAREAGLGVTIHAGEWDGAQSVWDAVGNLGCHRIGHGIRCLEDPGIVSILAERGTILEVCPSSNVDSGVVDTLERHPFPLLVEHGINATLCTDDPLISDINLTDEVFRAMKHMGMSLDDVKQSILRGAEGAFLPDDRRERLVNKMRGLLEIPV